MDGAAKQVDVLFLDIDGVLLPFNPDSEDGHEEDLPEPCDCPECGAMWLDCPAWSCDGCDASHRDPCSRSISVTANGRQLCGDCTAKPAEAADPIAPAAQVSGGVSPVPETPKPVPKVSEQTIEDAPTAHPETFHDECLRALDSIVARTACTVVLSSTWRYSTVPYSWRLPQIAY